jgi:hypothetical protein
MDDPQVSPFIISKGRVLCEKGGLSGRQERSGVRISGQWLKSEWRGEKEG